MGLCPSNEKRPCYKENVFGQNTNTCQSKQMGYNQPNQAIIYNPPISTQPVYANNGNQNVIYPNGSQTQNYPNPPSAQNQAYPAPPLVVPQNACPPIEQVNIPQQAPQGNQLPQQQANINQGMPQPPNVYQNMQLQTNMQVNTLNPPVAFHNPPVVYQNVQPQIVYTQPAPVVITTQNGFVPRQGPVIYDNDDYGCGNNMREIEREMRWEDREIRREIREEERFDRDFFDNDRDFRRDDRDWDDNRGGFDGDVVIGFDF